MRTLGERTLCVLERAGSVVFQHGESADDYLLAHTLAMIAMSKGDPTAIWIASATLDRYLGKIGQKQVFGTQYSRDSQHGWTQGPYDRGLVPMLFVCSLACLLNPSSQSS